MSHFSLTAISSRSSKTRWIFRSISYRRVGAFTAISDFALILMASIATGIGYHAFAFEIEGDIGSFCAIGSFCGSIFVIFSKSLELYRPDALLSSRAQLRGILIAWGSALLFGFSILFLLKAGAHYSRGAIIGFGFLGFGLLVASRTVIRVNLRQALADGSLAGPRVIVIGDPEELAATPSRQLLRTYGTREVGRFELSPGADGSHSSLAYDLAVVDSGIRIAQSQRAEQVLLAIRWVDTARRDLICERLRALPLPVFLLPDRFVSSIVFQASRELYARTVIEVQRAPLSRQNMIAKRFFDVVLASLGLVILSPLLLAIGIAIKLESPGPAIFRQRRKGFNGEVFGIYKFRTMTVLEDGPVIQQAQRNDHRVTWLGRFLRASSMDELPQLFNVLAGEMSLVGPRPHTVAHHEKYSRSIDNYALRHHVKPGITGWAQIHGFRGATTDPALMDKRVQHDLWYINNWSSWLDLRILARTVVEVLRFRNAY
jgi:undecaprenyl-phosphate galactose phosphotransferase/putative colanic acid biosynthesis UDP-glucose lipid carrier transferase